MNRLDEMKITRIIGSTVFFTALLLGCDSSDLKVVEAPQGEGGRPISSGEVDVFNEYIAAANDAPQKPAIGANNYYENPGFELGLAGWNSCNGGATGISDDAFEGINALELGSDSCIYRSVETDPGNTYVLSCTVKLTAGKAWTAMGMTFSNGAYVSLAEGPVAEATSKKYTTLISKGTAPAGASFVSMWLHSDHGALVDNCSLMLESNRPPVTPVEGNLLSNSDFSVFDAKGYAAEWALGCGGTATADGDSLSISKAGCVDQALTEGAIESIKNNTATFGCDIAAVDGYSDLSIYLDGKLAGVQQIKPEQSGSFVSFDVEAGNVSNGFVSLYSDGILAVNQCALTATGRDEITDPGTGSTPAIPNARIDVRNNLEGPDVWLSPDLPIGYQIDVINSGEVPLTDITVVSDTLDTCALNYASLAVGEIRTANCINLLDRHTHTVTATATTSDGLVVSDSDASTNTFSSAAYKNVSRHFSITASSNTANDGDDVTFTVEAGNTGTFNRLIETVNSNVESCNRDFSPGISVGKFERYNCIARNIEVPFIAMVGGDLTTRDSSVVIHEAGNIIDISHDIEGDLLDRTPNSEVPVTVTNRGSADLTNVEVVSSEASCNWLTPLLKAGETAEYTCQQPNPPVGETTMTTAVVTATSTSTDGAIATDSDSTTYHNLSDFALDIQIGPTGGSLIGRPGEILDTSITFTNTGFFPVTTVEGFALTSQRSAGSVRPTVTVGIVDTSACESAVKEVVQQPNFRLEPGASYEVFCSLPMPDLLTSLAQRQRVSMSAGILYGGGPELKGTKIGSSTVSLDESSL